MNTAPLLSGLFLGLLGILPACFGEDPASQAGNVYDLEPVRVVALKRPLDPARVPAALSRIDGAELKREGIESVQDLAARIPNLLVSHFSAMGTSYPFVRGVGSGQGEPAVMTLIDGVPQATENSAHILFDDVESIEVLRGPASSLYGKSALGGVIRIETREPGGRPGGRVKFSSRNNGGRELGLGLQVPLSSSGACLRLSALHRGQGGEAQNVATGERMGAGEDNSGRLGLAFVPAEGWSARLAFFAESSRQDGFRLYDLDSILTYPHAVNLDYVGHSNRDILGTSALFEHRGSDMDASLLFSVNDWRTDAETDLDFSAQDLLRRQRTDTGREFYGEWRLSSQEDDSGRAWMLGASLSDDRREDRIANELRPLLSLATGFPAGFNINHLLGRSRNLGFFANLDLPLGSGLELGLGLRHDRETQRADFGSGFSSSLVNIALAAGSPERGDSSLSPTLSLAWKGWERLYLFIRHARGFKAGGFNLSPLTSRRTYGREDSQLLEAGCRLSLPESGLSGSLVLYRLLWRDMQLSLYDATSGSYYVDNAAEAESRGAELELSWAPSGPFTFFASLGSADASFLRYADPLLGDLSKRSLPFAPHFTWHLGARSESQRGAFTLSTQASMSAAGAYPYDAANTRSSGDVYQLNLRCGAARERWCAELWTRNALNEVSVPIAIPSTLQPNLFVGENASPRSAGIDISLSL
ncbi:MAG: TonB-dependent receptor [Planctomycetes bacterium]|nr:TonB-dependent receptor [Planctomycetota bacterium]